jgi:tetratricopeptide (TPR) repeat protein
MVKKSMAISALLILLSLAAFPESPPAPPSLFSLSLTPDFSLPLGRDTSLFSLGAGAQLAAEYRMPFLPLFFVGGEAGFSFVPVQAATSMSLLSGGITTGVRFDVLENVALKVTAAGGYFFGSLNNGSGSGSNPFASIGVDVGWQFMPSLSAGLGAAYRNFFGLYNDMAVSVGISYIFPSGGSSGQPAVQQKPLPEKPQPLKETTKAPPQQTVPVERDKGVAIYNLSFNKVFPIFHAFYDSNPIGKLTLRNTDSSTATDITLSLYIKAYMDAPKTCVTIPALKPGEQRDIDLLALFRNDILEITQTTKVAGEIALSYTRNGKPTTASKVETVTVYDRNAMSWDDNQKAAAFVTPKEPVVMFYSNNINAVIKDKMNRVLDRNLQTAIAFHDALRLNGISYVSPPLTSYAVVSQDKQAVDSLKFPRETMSYRSGDCSDLSILYCSLLESVQIETAFITVPGHIFMAFALAATEDEARKTFTRTDELIFQQGKVWVPVEVTERTGTFLTAWAEGAKEWRENVVKKQADFYPVRTAWKTYEAVFFPGTGAQPPLPDSTKMLKDFQGDLASLIDREISNREAELRSTITRNPGSTRAVNALGLLYARYGINDKAEAQFSKVLDKTDYVPALINMGNLFFLRQNYERALLFYTRAYKQAPKDPTVLLCMARANHELQNYGEVKKEFSTLRTINPDLASQFSYLDLQGDEATRAAEVSHARDIVLWQEGK